MSDQDEWSKPGETPEQRDQHARDPFATSGQGSASQGVTDPGGDPAGHVPADRSTGYPGPQQDGRTSAPGSSSTGSHAYGGQSDGQYGQQPAGQYGQQSTGQYGQQSAGQYGQQNPYAQNPYGQSSHAQNPYGQNPYGQNPYGQNPYGQTNPYAATGYQPSVQRGKTSLLAILSLVFALGGIVIWPLVILTSPAGAIMGHVALGRMKHSGEQGRGLAIAGIVCGWALTALYVIGLVLFIAFVTSHSYSDYGSDSSGYGGSGA